MEDHVPGHCCSLHWTASPGSGGHFYAPLRRTLEVVLSGSSALGCSFPVENFARGPLSSPDSGTDLFRRVKNFQCSRPVLHDQAFSQPASNSRKRPLRGNKQHGELRCCDHCLTVNSLKSADSRPFVTLLPVRKRSFGPCSRSLLSLSNMTGAKKIRHPAFRATGPC